MFLEELDYSLPPELIACRPAEPRDSSRLMVLHRRTGKIEHQIFSDLPSHLVPGDLLIPNSARVLPARLRVRSPGDKEIEILVLGSDGSSSCRAWLSPARKVREGMELLSPQGKIPIRVSGRNEDGAWRLELKSEGGWLEFLKREGSMPIPPYILKQRKFPNDLPEDRAWYQTTFAERDGAVAAPTAGLHFTTELLGKIKTRGVHLAKIYLGVGPGTFQPVRTNPVEDHVLEPEDYEIDGRTAELIRATKSDKRRVIAVGTTVTRALESAIGSDGLPQTGMGRTRLMILPPFPFKVVDILLTNFHLPRSTLLALVYAFAGTDLTRYAYAEAIKERYRFYSYGDAMLIL